MIATEAYPRAALIGNPSDGYYGKTLSFTFDNFRAKVIIDKNDKISISSNGKNKIVFKNIMELINTISKNGYSYISELVEHKLTLAMIKRFYEKIFVEENRSFDGFDFFYTSNIPQSLGLAGSSAIITAGLKGLLSYFELSMSKLEMILFVLEVETEELGISAGLQDRVVQVLNYPVFMDFKKEQVLKTGNGKYSRIEYLDQLNLYIAYPLDLSESSEITHNNLSQRYKDGDPIVLEAISEFKSLSDSFLNALVHNDQSLMNDLINENYNLRKSILTINPAFDQVINRLRTLGCSAKFAGSGGAVVGLYPNERVYDHAKVMMAQENISIFKPNIVSLNAN